MNPNLRALLPFCLLALAAPLNTNSATVAYYRFEEGINGVLASGASSILDTSGNGLNGTPSGTVTYSSNIPVGPIPETGASNHLSLAFDGSTGRIQIPDSPLLGLTNSLTLEAYILPTAPGGGPYGVGQIVFRGDDRPGLDPYYLALFGTNLYFQVQDQSNNAANLSCPITINQWHHVAGTLNGTNGVMSLYLDGILMTQTITTIRPYASLTGANPGLGIGNVEDTSNVEYFAGLIDELRVSDTALATNQFLRASPTATLSSLKSQLLPALVLYGTAGAQFDIQSVPVLGGGTNWTTIATVTLTTSQPYIYVDPASLTNSQSFYRAVPH